MLMSNVINSRYKLKNMPSNSEQVIRFCLLFRLSVFKPSFVFVYLLSFFLFDIRFGPIRFIIKYRSSKSTIKLQPIIIRYRILISEYTSNLYFLKHHEYAKIFVVLCLIILAFGSNKPLKKKVGFSWPSLIWSGHIAGQTVNFNYSSHVSSKAVEVELVYFIIAGDNSKGKQLGWVKTSNQIDFHFSVLWGNH